MTMLATACWSLIVVTLLAAAGIQAQSSRDTDPSVIRTGGTLYRERCADCHGADAKGVRGPDLTVLWTSDASDQRVMQTIRQGIPGTIMPPTTAPDEEIRAITAYLRSISTVKTTPTDAARGNVAKGEAFFWASCGACHRIGDRGGRLGPDLTRIAASQSRDALTTSIRQPSASFSSGYEPVTVVTREGRTIRGTRKGEDAYSIQIMDTHERLQGFLKASVREVKRDAESLMPGFGADRLSDRDLDDLLAFLATLRGSESAARGRP